MLASRVQARTLRWYAIILIAFACIGAACRASSGAGRRRARAASVRRGASLRRTGETASSGRAPELRRRFYLAIGARVSLREGRSALLGG